MGFSKLINLALLQIQAVSVTWQFFSEASIIECIICVTIDLKGLRTATKDLSIPSHNSLICLTERSTQIFDKQMFFLFHSFPCVRVVGIGFQSYLRCIDYNSQSIILSYVSNYFQKRAIFYKDVAIVAFCIFYSILSASHYWIDRWPFWLSTYRQRYIRNDFILCPLPSHSDKRK